MSDRKWLSAWLILSSIKKEKFTLTKSNEKNKETSYSQETVIGDDTQEYRTAIVT